MKFKGEKIWDYKISEILKRNEGERKETIKWVRVTCKRIKTRKRAKKE